jgi:hypothetical protein
MRWISVTLACLSIPFELGSAEPQLTDPAKPAGGINYTTGGANSKPKRFASLEEMQAEFYDRFVNTPGNGMGRMLPAPLPPLQIVLDSSTYSVSPPHLIGLEDSPVAYVPLRQMPVKGDFTQKEIRKLMRTRQMSAAETNGLSLLRDGAAIAVVTNQTQISPRVSASFSGPLVVLGALRAGSACADCHRCEVGKLLGALTYILTPLTVQPGLATNSIPDGSRTAAQTNKSPTAVSVARRSRL